MAGTWQRKHEISRIGKGKSCPSVHPDVAHYSTPCTPQFSSVSVCLLEKWIHHQEKPESSVCQYSKLCYRYEYISLDSVKEINHNAHHQVDSCLVIDQILMLRTLHLSSSPVIFSGYCQARHWCCQWSYATCLSRHYPLFLIYLHSIELQYLFLWWLFQFTVSIIKNRIYLVAIIIKIIKIILPPSQKSEKVQKDFF